MACLIMNANVKSTDLSIKNINVCLARHFIKQGFFSKCVERKNFG
jgi:hypothetical protein